jgi:hypothetical protein
LHTPTITGPLLPPAIATPRSDTRSAACGRPSRLTLSSPSWWSRL